MDSEDICIEIHRMYENVIFSHLIIFYDVNVCINFRITFLQPSCVMLVISFIQMIFNNDIDIALQVFLFFSIKEART